MHSKTTSRIVVVLLLTAGAQVVGAAQTAAPNVASWRFLGRWKLNAARSDVKSSQMTVTRAPSGEMTMTLQGMTQTFRLDGQERPSVAGSTAIWTETGPRSWRTVYRMANTDNNIDQYTLSENGATLTMKTDYLVPKPSQQTLTFTRVSGGPGLPGVWKAETMQSENEFEMSSRDGRSVTMNFVTTGASAVTPVDGTDVPMAGPPAIVPPGLTVALTVTGAGSFDFVEKMNGAVLSTGHWVVAADGRTMTVDGINGPSSSGSDRVKFVYEKR